MARTVIIGAGVIGLTLAFELLQRGDEVVIVERKLPGSGSSSGNAGWIVPSISTPVPAPGLPKTAIRWMADPESPLYIKPRLDPRFLRWMWSFFRSCREEDYVRGRAALISLASGAQQGFDRLQAQGVQFEMANAGLLVLGFSDEALDHHLEETALMAEIGYQPAERLTGPEVREIEPMLSADVAGGVLVSDDRHVRPESLVDGLVDAVQKSGGTIIESAAIDDIVRDDRSVGAVLAGERRIEGNRFVLAAGAWSGRLARHAGFDLPLEAGKGYSISIDQPDLELNHPLDLIEARAAVTPFEGALRFAGTMEISGTNLRFERRRAEAIWRNVHRYLSRPVRGARMRAWVGMRPMTPDGLPVIGRIPGYDNFYIATGHQMLGVTLAPTTATALADLMHGNQPSANLAPFDPLRYV